MTLDSDQFLDWCVGVLVLVFAAGMIIVAFNAGGGAVKKSKQPQGQ